MAYEPTSYEVRILEGMYNKSLSSISKKNVGSLLFYLIGTTANERHRILAESSTEYIERDSVYNLKNANLIRDSDDIGRFTLTSKSVWLIDEKRGFSIEQLVDMIDTKYFDIFGHSNVSDKFKIILLSMISIRTYSSSSTVDMRAEMDVKDAWWEIFLSHSNFLINYEIINEKSSMDNYRSSSKIEHPASDIIRHSDKLPRSTKNIFSKTGKNQYFLDVMKNDSIDTEKLAYIIFLVFGNKLNHSNIYEISKFVCSFGRLYGLSVINSLETNYYQIHYDDVINEAFKLALEMKNVW